MHQRDYFLKKARQSNDELHWSSYRRTRNRRTSKIKFKKGRYNKIMLEENIDGNPKTFWETIKTIFPSKSHDNSPLQSLKIDGEVISGNKSRLANALNYYFTVAVSKLAACITPSAAHSAGVVG